MVVVGPRLQDGDNRAAVGVSIGGVGVGRDYAHLGNRIRRGIVSDEVVLRLVIVGAFDCVVVGLGAIAIDRHLSVVVGIALDRIVPRHALRIGIDGAGLEKGKRREVTAIQRNVCDLIGREGTPQ